MASDTPSIVVTPTTSTTSFFTADLARIETDKAIKTKENNYRETKLNQILSVTNGIILKQSKTGADFIILDYISSSSDRDWFRNKLIENGYTVEDYSYQKNGHTVTTLKVKW